MSAIRLVELDELLLREAIGLERDTMIAALCEGRAFAARALIPGLAVAAIEGGEVLGAGGLIPHWPGRAEAWLLVSRAASRRQVVAGMRLARQWLDRRQQFPLFRRLEIYIRTEAPWRQSFAAALGFRREANLEAWGPDGEAFTLYSRIRALAQLAEAAE